MAIAFDASSSGSVNSTSLTVSHTCSGSERILFACITTYTNNSDAVTGVTYNGVAMTRVPTDGYQAMSGNAVYLYYLVAPSAGTFDMVISVASSRLIKTVNASFTGVEQVNPIDASTKGTQATATTTTATITTTTNNCWLIASMSNEGSAYAAGANTTIRVAESDIECDSNGPKTPAGSHSLIATHTNARDGWCAAAFKPSTAVAATAKLLLLTGAGT